MFITKKEELITDIAQECGYGTDSYFSKVFMEHECISPTQYRAFCRKRTADGDK